MRQKWTYPPYYAQLQIREKTEAGFEDIKATTRPAPLRLLTLPAELRNRIYELTLGHEQPIEMDSSVKQPALLSVNRQVRSEAKRIWYRSNTFAFHIEGYDDTLVRQFYANCLANGGNTKIKLRLRGVGNWTNLLNWCKHIWHGQSISATKAEPGEHGRTFCIMLAAHEVVEQHLQNGRSWGECAVALESMRKLVQKLHPAWT